MALTSWIALREMFCVVGQSETNKPLGASDWHRSWPPDKTSSFNSNAFPRCLKVYICYSPTTRDIFHWYSPLISWTCACPQRSSTPAIHFPLTLLQGHFPVILSASATGQAEWIAPAALPCWYRWETLIQPPIMSPRPASPGCHSMDYLQDVQQKWKRSPLVHLVCFLCTEMIT